MVKAKITSRGQITVPKIIREKLKANPGKELEFKVISEKEAVIKVIEKPTADKLAGSLNPEGIVAEEKDWEKEVNEARVRKWQSEIKDD